jgi:DNA-binding beta-propeller fold protein YncE
MLSGGMAAAAGKGKIVVANRQSGTISVIDAGNDKLLDTVALPPGALTPEPMYVVNTPAKNRVWVGDRANNRVVVFNGNDFSVETVLATGQGVFHMWADQVGRQLWIVNDIDRTVTVVDGQKLEVLATVPMPNDPILAEAKPHDVTLDPLGIYAYVTFLNVPGPSDVVVQFDTQTFLETNRALVGKDPHLSFNAKNDEIYVPCQNSNAVFVLDAVTLALVDLLPIPGAHGAITSTNSRQFFTTNLPGGGTAAIYGVNTKNNTVLLPPPDTSFPVPHNLALTPNGKKLYVTHSGPNDQVSVFKTSKDGPPKLLRTVTVGSNPFGLAHVR